MNTTPEGYATLTPNVSVKDAAKAIDIYKKAFGAKEIDRITTSEGNKVMHAVLEIGNSKIFLSDQFPGCPAAQNVGFYLYMPDVDTALKTAEQAGLKVTMPAEEMFWGDRLGAVTDEFGIQWSIATHVKDVSSDDIEKGKKEFEAKMKAEMSGKSAGQKAA